MRRLLPLMLISDQSWVSRTLALFDPVSLEGLSSAIFCQLFQFQWNLVFLVCYNKKSFSQIQPGLSLYFLGSLKCCRHYSSILIYPS